MRLATNERAGYRCEWPGCDVRETDPAHGFGRGAKAHRGIADHPALGWRACRHHHDVFDGHRRATTEEEAALAEVQWWLVGMAERELGSVTREPGDRPIDVVRRLERQLGHLRLRELAAELGW